MNKIQSIISAIVVLVVEGGSLFGLSVSDSAATTVITMIVAIAAAVYGIYKNHNFSDAAVTAQQVLNSLKSGEEEEME